jgi:hypothetical protein
VSSALARGRLWSAIQLRAIDLESETSVVGPDAIPGLIGGGYLDSPVGCPLGGSSLWTLDSPAPCTRTAEVLPESRVPCSLGWAVQRKILCSRDPSANVLACLDDRGRAEPVLAPALGFDFYGSAPSARCNNDAPHPSRPPGRSV